MHAASYCYYHRHRHQEDHSCSVVAENTKKTKPKTKVDAAQGTSFAKRYNFTQIKYVLMIIIHVNCFGGGTI